MKRMVKAVGLGVSLGLAGVIIHEVMASEEFQRAVRETTDKVKEVLQAKQVSSEDTAWKEDPQANRDWVERQWEAVLD